MGVGVERTQLDGLAVRLHGLVEQPAGRGEEEIAEGLHRAPDTSGSSWAAARNWAAAFQRLFERLVDAPERVHGDGEGRIGLRRLGQQLDRRLVALLTAPLGGH